MKVLRNWHFKFPVRKWQAQAERRFHALDHKDFLLVATPASGKTTIALKIAHNLLSDGSIERCRHRRSDRSLEESVDGSRRPRGH